MMLDKINPFTIEKAFSDNLWASQESIPPDTNIAVWDRNVLDQITDTIGEKL